MQELFMDIYEPKGDTMSQRPVMIFAFGGGFIQGDRFEKHVTRTCEQFAKAGYVAVAIDYRIGIDIVGGLSNPSGEGMRVFFRAVQDMRAATQYMYYSADQLGNPYRIDTNAIFVGGASAGAITALMMEYGDKLSEFDDLANPSEIASLGGFDTSSANGPHGSYGYKSIGVVNIAGALPNVDWIEPGDVPVLSAHGDEDDTVPYKDEASLNSLLQLVGIELEGSFLVDQEAEAEGVCSYLYTMVGEDHPSNGRSDYYFQNIYHRLMPRMKAILDGKTFCCDMEVSIQGDTLVGIYNNGDEVELTSTLSNDMGAAQLSWCSYPNAGSSDQASFTVNPEPDSLEEGTQYYTVTATEGNCVATDLVAVQRVDSIADTTTSIDARTESLDARLYPNPAQGMITVELADYRNVNYQILDLSGKVLQTGKLNNNKQSLNLSQLSAGQYILLLRDGEGNFGRQLFSKVR